jgi:tetratricopeptide (TPR) repeat protein
MRTGEALEKSLEFFQQAIDLDPGYSLAYSGMADSLFGLAVYGVRHPNETFPKVEAAAKKALEIDDSRAEAHYSLATVLWAYHRDWSAVEREFRRAIELGPQYATAHQGYAIYLSSMGRHEEAIAEAERADTLDPLSPAISVTVGMFLAYAHRYDEAIERYRRSLEIHADHPVVYRWLSYAYVQKGIYEEAIATSENAVSLSGGNHLYLAPHGYVTAAAGEREQALRIIETLKELAKSLPISQYQMALTYAELGESEEAFEWLEKAWLEHDFWLPFLRYEPTFDPLRDDPRFQDLVRRLNFPE